MWVALLTMALTSFSLVTAEFLPGGLLTPIADEIGITVGLAAQLVTATAIVGFLVAPMVTSLAPGVDRRTLLVTLAMLAVVSNIVVAIAPTFVLLLIARFLLGAALSAFWAMSLTVVSHIAGAEHVGRGMMLVNSGTTLATVLGVPIGIVLAAVLGWRETFLVVAGLTALTAMAIYAFLPRVPAKTGMGFMSLIATLRRKGIPLALAGHVLIVLGHMAAYALIRIAIERISGIDPDGVALFIVIFGIGGVIGNFGFGALADRFLTALKVIVPISIAVPVALLATLPPLPVTVGAAVFLWGAGFGGWLVVINTWSAKRAPDQLEAMGGLVVAGFQLAIAIGAGVGGFIVDQIGIEAALVFAAGSVAVGLALFVSARDGVSQQG